MTEWIAAGVGTLWTICVLVWLLLVWLRAAGRVAIAEQSAKKATEQAEQLAKSLSESQKEREAAIRWAEREQKKRDEQFRFIEDSSREASATWSLYRRQSIEAGNAQAMLLRELDRICALHNKMAKKCGANPVEVDPRVLRVISEYSESHMHDESAKADQLKIVQNQHKSEQEALKNLSGPT